MAFAGVGVAIALLGLSIASARSALVPGWFVVLGPIGAALLLAGSAPVVPAVQGASTRLFMFAGFPVWLLWMVVAGLGLWRETNPAA